MKNSQGGFIGLLLLIIVALAALKYFLNFDIFSAAATPQGQGTISYLGRLWDYVSPAVMFVWNQIMQPILSLAWQSLQAFLQWGKTNAAQGI